MSLTTKEKITLFWHRRDLRLEDNAGLYYALKSDYPVVPLFIFDRNILDNLDNKKDSRVTFIYETVTSMREELKKTGADILVEYGYPNEIWKALSEKYSIAEV